MIDSLKSGGKWDGTKLTTFVSFVILVVSWAVDQFYGLKVNESIFWTFAGIVVSGLGLKTFTDKKINDTTENK
jgi:hypothetical protein